jgi:hypothetical protein
LRNCAGAVADQRQHLALLVNRDAAVLLRRPVEPADGRALERADGGDLRGFEAFGAGELRQHGDRLIARIAHRRSDAYAAVSLMYLDVKITTGGPG